MKDKDSKLFVVEKESESTSIRLPFSEGEFKEFITGLLGKPQTIEKTISNEFELASHHIEHIYNAIQQRITQQNNGHLIAFQAQMSFSDNSSVLVNSLNELLTFNVIKPVICEELNLTFQYLITFSDKKVPEKQEINVSFYAPTNSGKIAQSVISAFLSDEDSGEIEVSIKYTARTWGADIEALLTQVLSDVRTPENKFLKFIRAKFFFIFLALICLFFIASFQLSSKISQAENTVRNQQIAELFGTPSENLVQIDDKLKFINDSVNRINSPTTNVRLTIIGLIVTVVITLILIIALAQTKKNSFILLTSESQKYKEQAQKRAQRSWIVFFFSLIFAITCDLAANYIYDLITK